MIKRGLNYLSVKGFDNKKTTAVSSSCSLLFNDKTEENSKNCNYEVFLGGSCNPTTWRAEIAIPALTNLGITYYNPQVSNWVPELIAEEHEAKKAARILFFVIDEKTRNCASLIEAAFLGATRKKSLVTVIHSYKKGQSINGENISNDEYSDLTNALKVLQYILVKQKIPIFHNIASALNCTSKILRTSLKFHDLNVKNGTKHTKFSTSQKGNNVIKLENILKSLDFKDSGIINITQAYDAMSSFKNKNVNYGFMDIISNYGEWNLLNKHSGLYINDLTTAFISNSQRKDLYISIKSQVSATWLKSVAVPLLNSAKLTCHYSASNNYKAKQLSMELKKMRDSKLILLIISSSSRDICEMILAAHLIGTRGNIVLCVQMLPDNLVVNGEQLTEKAIKDYNRGRLYLSDLAKREGVPVFQNINDSLHYSIQRAKDLK